MLTILEYGQRPALSHITKKVNRTLLSIKSLFTRLVSGSEMLLDAVRQLSTNTCGQKWCATATDRARRRGKGSWIDVDVRISSNAYYDIGRIVHAAVNFSKVCRLRADRNPMLNEVCKGVQIYVY